MVIIGPLLIYLFYTRDNVAQDIDYSNLYDINWGNCQVGKYLGPTLDHNVTCRDLCGSGSYETIYLNQQRANEMSSDKYTYRPGYWCFPEAVEKCNLSTNLLLVSESETIQCVNRFPQVLNNNKIIGCNPTNQIVDRLTHTIYSEYIPSTLTVTNLDELLDDGTFRFMCNRDDKTFAPFNGNRFFTIENKCNILADSQSTSKPPQFKHGNISCACDNFLMNDDDLICTDCTSGFGIVDEHYPQEGSEYAYSLGLTCVDPNHDNYALSLNAALPCGIKTLERIREEGKPTGCMRAIVDATNTYSPSTLAKIVKNNQASS